MKSLRLTLVGVLFAIMLTGCGAEENHENTTATHTPEPTIGTTEKPKDKDNIIDDAGDAVKDAGDAVGNTVKDVGDSMKN